MAPARLFRTILIAVSLVPAVAVARPDGGQESAPKSDAPIPATTDSVLLVGEELTYNVTFGPVDLGQIRITVTGKRSSGRQSYYTATAKIDSYKGVPFVTVHALYEDRIVDGMYSSWFHSRKKDDDQWETTEYAFDYPRHRVTMVQGVAGSSRIDKKETLQVDTFYQDGLSLFFLARNQLLSNRAMMIPTIVNEKLGTTRIRFSEDRSAERIGAVDYPIDVVHFDGDAGFVGIMGLAGGFEGWFSNDAARVPIIAKMRVVIGNVRVELMKWKRPGWSPPRAPEGK